MYIVAIAWLYVTLLMAAAETSLVAGAMTFLWYGLAPLALFLWLFGGPRRRRAAEQRARRSVAGEQAHDPDGSNAEADQYRLLQGGEELGAPMQSGDQIGNGDVEHARRGDGDQ